MRFLTIIFFFGIFTQTIAQTDGENLFDDTFLHEIHFTNVDTNSFLANKEYQMGTMEIDGQTVTDVGFKRKGNISGYPSTNKFPIKVKTNKYVQGQEYDGIKEFMLHMNYQDPTMLREKLTYEICAEMGLYSLRTAFAKVYIDEVYWGLYTIVEGKDEMYKHVFDNRNADAMENSEFGGMCYSGPDIDDYYNANFNTYVYENDNGNFDTAWERFITALDKLNNTPDDVYVDTVSNYFNIEDFFTYQAINVYLLNMDSYIWFIGNQRYVFDEMENIWQVTPWDFNASFGLWNTNNATVTDYPLLPSFTCFGSKINSVPALKNYYFDGMCELTNVVCDTTKMYARIDELKAQIEEAVYEDYRKVVTNQDFDNGTEFGYHQLFFDNQPALKTVLRERYHLITNGLMSENYECMPTNTNEELAAAATFSIYPNPANEVLYFETDLLEKAGTQLTIVDAFGQTVFAGIVEGNQLNIANLASGLYYGIIENGQERVTQKFVKQ